MSESDRCVKKAAERQCRADIVREQSIDAAINSLSPVFVSGVEKLIKSLCQKKEK